MKAVSETFLNMPRLCKQGLASSIDMFTKILFRALSTAFHQWIPSRALSLVFCDMLIDDCSYTAILCSKLKKDNINT